MQIRNCTPDDIQAIRHFVGHCKPLGVHTGYTYWVMFHYFAQSCFLMEEGEQVVGYVSGMKSDEIKDVFSSGKLALPRSFAHEVTLLNYSKK